jgi:non-specific serine/threonine protein kinase
MSPANRRPQQPRVERDLGPALDIRARHAYQARLSELRDALDEARRFQDLGRAEGLQAEMDAIAGALRSAIGLGGRDRPVGSPAERARMTVSKRIRAALKRIGELHPPLGRHLNRCIRTGVYCSYTLPPEEPVRWTF